MKKICSLIFLLIISVNMVVYADSTNEDKQNLVSLNYEKEGEEIKVVLKVDDISKDGIMGLQGTLNYDHEKLELVDKKILVENFNITSYSEKTGIFMIEVTDEAFFDKNKYIKPEQSVLELNFKEKEQSDGEKIQVSSIIMVNSNYSTINAVDVEIMIGNSETVSTTNVENVEEIKENKISKIIAPVILGIIILFVLIKIIQRKK